MNVAQKKKFEDHSWKISIKLYGKGSKLSPDIKEKKYFS